MPQKSLYAMGMLALLTSCATGLSEEECRSGRAGNVGYEDGINGSRLSRVDDRIEQCARYEISFDDRAYASGWRDGNAIFCTPEGALAVALRGQGDIRACPSASFLTTEAFRIGRAHEAAEDELDSARSEYNSLFSRIDSLRRNIDITARKLRDEPDANQRRELAERLQRYRRDLREVYDKIDYAERRIRYAENDLNRAEYELVRLRTELRRRANSAPATSSATPLSEAPEPEPAPAPAPEEGSAEFPDLLDGE